MTTDIKTDALTQPPEPNKVLLEVVDHEETRDIEQVWNADHTKIVALRPTNERQFFILRTPTGREIKVELSLDDFNHVISLWQPSWLTHPE